jgi:hypothetical protein
MAKEIPCLQIVALVADLTGTAVMRKEIQIIPPDRIAFNGNNGPI